MKKRMLTMLLALILVLAALPVASLAAEPKTEPPELVGNMAIQDGGTYYLSMVVAVADEDEDLTKVTLNGEDVEIDDPYSVALRLEGNKEATYKIHAEDQAGNVLDATLYMKPLSALLVGLDGVTEENVKSSHLEAVQTAEQALLDQAGLFEEDFCPQSEMDELLALVKQCRALEKKIYEVEAAADKLAQDMDALPDPTKDSREQYEAVLAQTQALLDGNNLTDEEREALEALREVLENVIGDLDAVQDVLAEARVTAAKDPKAVTADDLDELKAVEYNLGIILRTTYLTDAEREEATALLEKVTELRKLAEKAAEDNKPTEPKPTEPTKPVDPTNPATGDGMNVALSVALCLAAAIGMAGVAITRREF